MAMLHAFVDETGDEGVKGTGSPWLSLGGWIVPENQLNPIKKFIVEGVEKVWQGKKLPDHVHFHEQPHGRRKALLQMLCSLNFTALAVPALKSAFRAETL